MSPDDSAAIARRFLEAAGRGDIDTIVALLSEDATWWVPRPFGERIASAAGGRFPAEGPVRGRTAILTEFVGPVQALLVPGSQRLRIDEVIGDGAKVVVLMHVDADIVAGGTYTNDFSVFFEVRDGRIVAVREYLDTLYAIEKLASH